MTRSSTQFLRALVLDQMEGTLDCGLDRTSPVDFDLLKEVTLESLQALSLLQRVDALNLQWHEIRAVKNLVLFHEGNEVPEDLVHPDTLEALFQKLNQA